MKYIFSLALIIFLTSCANSTKPADDYVLQILEPTGGKVYRPSSWYYQERHRAASSLYWVISKENPAHGYETGLAIQFMMGITKGTGMSPKEFMQKNLEERAKAGKLISRCEPENIGFFTRQCLEVEEVQVHQGKSIAYHILYSFFWGNETDMASITIAGSPVEAWPENKEIFNRMAEIELIDPNRFGTK